MSITSETIERGVAILRGHGATRVLLFGSALTSPRTARDLDLACDGLPPRRFLTALADLSEELGLPVDLVDLSGDSAFVETVRRRGRVVYETT